ncbi:MAG: hypothetical protein P0Y49_04380 [Candidatus Pedobacter colombiensis]|uniref:Uncharacterized protein n=1 Tax=Candidatus Pedobacter colombiensis TaxID=3121371 RepID=A0AAJ5W9D1_9SPHI|nr:hypothetical protein [Pedobacter sp.]WEK20376.1 MAG: hypothetical protein P0Y49_04380 [Pedobacter sp.]
MSVIQNYKINFFKRDILNRIYFGMNSSSNLLDQFITDDQKIEDVIETLEALIALKNGEISKMDYSSQSLVTIVANANNAAIYDRPDYTSNSPQFSISTQDLIIIVEAWKDYIVKNYEK